MNRQQRRQQEREIKKNGNTLHLSSLNNLEQISIEQLENLEQISMEDLQNMPQELRDLLQQKQETEQKQKRQYNKKQTQNQANVTSGSDGSNNDVAPKRPKFTAKQKRVNDGLVNIIGTMGTGLITAGTVSGKDVLKLDGMAVLHTALPIADNLIEVGKQFPQVMLVLEKMVEGNALIGLLGALGGLGTAIALNHGWIKQDALQGFFTTSETEVETGTALNN